MNDFKSKQEQDKYILELFQTAPKDAFRLLFDTYHLPLCLYVLQLTDSFQLAEDVVQDFFVYFWEKKYYLNIKQNLRYYLFYSVRNATFSALKQVNQLSLESISDLDYGLLDEWMEEEESDESRTFRLHHMLAQLPMQERQVVRAVILEEKKYKDAAQELQISVNTLKTHLSRALKHLRKAYCLRVFFW